MYVSLKSLLDNMDCNQMIDQVRTFLHELNFEVYQFFRTYSVDSSESSSDEGNEDKDVREEVEELNKVLSDLVRENRELEVRKL